MEKHELSIRDINKVLLERKSKIIVSKKQSTSSDNRLIVISILKNIEDLGYIFSRELFDLLIHKSEDYLIDLYHQLVFILTEMVGSHVEHKPFYRNFPQQMASLSELDLIMNALVHYWTNGQWQPEYVKISRLPIHEAKPQTRIISVGTTAEFHQIFTKMMLSNGSLSTSDQNLLGWYLESINLDEDHKLLPEVIPNKEILSLVVAKIREFHPSKFDLLKKYLNTATDILRYATTLSGGDNSLASNTHYVNFSRSERRFILSMLELCNNLEEDMGRHAGKWKRLGEKIHPGDYSNQFPSTYQVFKKIRNNEKLYSFYSQVEKSIEKRDLEKTLVLLRQRPGEFARKLDFLARTFPQGLGEIANRFEKVVKKCSSRVLIQLISHFKTRNRKSTTRSFFPKGNIAKVQVVENTLPSLPESFCEEIKGISEHELIIRLKEKSPLGKVYIDPKLKNFNVPISQRSSSRALKTYARGSRISLGESSSTIRAFIHWSNVLVNEDFEMVSTTLNSFQEDNETSEDAQDMMPIQDWRNVLHDPDGIGVPNLEINGVNSGKGNQIRTDIDLSLGLYDENWEYVEHISYTNIKSNEFEGLHHSGDIVDAPEGASEFIDMDIIALLASQVRYAVFNVYSFTEQGFNEIPECFFGWMEREEINSGEIFEPKTVANKIDLASPTIICLPVLFDLKLKQALWMDVSLRSNPKWVNNLEANRNNVVLISRAMLEMNKPNLFDLFFLNVQARGEFENDPKKADMTFGIGETDDVTPFQVEKILAEFI